MSYIALYRKFRPHTFEDVKGQEAIITTIKNQIKQNRIAHAYLFCGTRGTGKTTVAKVFAKAVNCLNITSKKQSPCNECRVCNNINNNSSLNIIEIDAASNNGVDSIRTIVDEVRYSPTEGKYKVYIIDEVHMLSTSAFNALLKTLEEPPAYVIFILATTDVHKVPVTVISRCQRFDFRRISVSIIKDRLIELISKEGIIAEEKAIEYIARMADGALRDALSLLDKCISYSLDNNITYDKTLKALGTVSITIFSRLLTHIKHEDIKSCIKLIDEIEYEGRELGQFTIDFIWYLRNVLLIQSSENMENVLEVSQEDILVLKEDSKLFASEIIIRFINVFSEIANQMKYAPRKRIALEIGIIKLCKPQMEENIGALNNRIANVEEKIKKGTSILVESNTAETKAYKTKEIIPRKVPKATYEELEVLTKNWQKIIKLVEKRSSPLGIALAKTNIVIDMENKFVILVFEEVFYDIINREKNIDLIKLELEKFINKKVDIRTKYLKEGSKDEKQFQDIESLVKMTIDSID